MRFSGPSSVMFAVQGKEQSRRLKRRLSVIQRIYFYVLALNGVKKNIFFPSCCIFFPISIVSKFRLKKDFVLQMLS